jgi:hypothetical protein
MYIWSLMFREMCYLYIFYIYFVHTLIFSVKPIHIRWRCVICTHAHIWCRTHACEMRSHMHEFHTKYERVYKYHLSMFDLTDYYFICTTPKFLFSFPYCSIFSIYILCFKFYIYLHTIKAISYMDSNFQGLN